MSSTVPFFGVRFRQLSTPMISQEESSSWGIPPLDPDRDLRVTDEGIRIPIDNGFSLSVGRARKLLYQYK